MARFFWETTQRARRTHFCDRCHQWIEPGEIYMRRAWVPDGRDYFLIWKEHEEPSCPPNEMEEMIQEGLRKERAALGVPIALEVRMKAVHLVRINGQTETKLVPEVVPVSVPVEPYFDPDDGEEIPF